jgi:hypothetical protein
MATRFAHGSTWSELKELFSDLGIPLTRSRLRDVSLATLGIA